MPDEVHRESPVRSPPAGELQSAVDDPGLLIYERVLPALPESVARIRNELRGSLTWHGLAADRHADIALVVSEAATNAVVHAYLDTAPGPLYAAATLGGDSLTVWVSDFGHGMLPSRDSAGLGLGSILMSMLSDDLVISSGAGTAGTCVTATFNRIKGVGGNRADPRYGGSPRREILVDYLQALRASNTALRQDTEAVLAEAGLAVARARRQRHERAQRRRLTG